MPIKLSNIPISQLDDVAQQIISAANQYKIWTFYGQMGAGKTTLIKQIGKQLGVIDDISSPTYSLVNEYKTNDGNSLFHFDFYRINNIAEVYDIGYEDYFYSGNICLIEWPEKIEQLLKHEDFFRIDIEKMEEGYRNFVISNS